MEGLLDQSSRQVSQLPTGVRRLTQPSVVSARSSEGEGRMWCCVKWGRTVGPDKQELKRGIRTSQVRQAIPRGQSINRLALIQGKPSSMESFLTLWRGTVIHWEPLYKFIKN